MILGPVSLETTRRALAHVDAHDRDLWVRMAFACKSEHGEDGYGVWDAWSQGADNYREKAARDVWKSAKPGNIGIGTLLYEAGQRGFKLNGEASRIDPAEIERHKGERADALKREEGERKARQARAAEWAGAIWKAAQPAGADHPYLHRKAVATVATMREIAAERAREILAYTPKTDDEALEGRLLVLPVKINGQLATLELIDEQGRKTGLYGGARAGGYWAPQALPDHTEALCIGEGAATMLSVREAMGLPVVAALSAGNLLNVARAMRTKYQRARLIVCGDLGKGGEDKARKAAQDAGALLALPGFGADRCDGQTDFNDLALAKGPEAVKAAIAGACQVSEAHKSEPQAAIVHARLSTIKARPIRWLWPGRIARGKVSMIAGHPGLGKSQITTSLAAIVTKGGRWPVDRTPCELGSVLLLSAEDDVADTIRPRLEAAGADLDRVHILQAVRAGFNSSGDEIQRAFSLSEDIRRLENLLTEIGDVALIVIDPVSAYLGDADSHCNADVRALLAPLSDMAGRTGAAVLAVSHLNKGGGGTGGDALLRVTGSLAFVAAARAAYIVAKDPGDERRRLLLPAKNNVGPDVGGLAFNIEAADLAGGIQTSKIVWDAEPVNGVSADELLRAPVDQDERSALEDAKAWLRGMLADGPAPSKRVMAEAREAGHPERTMFRARQSIGVEAIKDGKTGPWMLRLPLKAAKNAEDCHVSSDGNVGSLGSLGTNTVAETF